MAFSHSENKGVGSTNGTYRLSGKSSPESGGFLFLFGIFEIRLSVIRVGLQSPEHALGGADADPVHAGGSVIFVVLTQPPVAVHTGDGLLHHPAYLQRHEPLLVGGLARRLDPV